MGNDSLLQVAKDILEEFDTKKNRKKWCWFGDGDCVCRGCQLLDRLRSVVQRED